MAEGPIIEPLIGVPGVLRVSAQRELSEPRLAIVGAVHGNERCGLIAIERLERELREGLLELRTGTIYLVHGNPEASASQRRHSEQGPDLNRLFDYQFVRELDQSRWQLEHHRALALRPILESIDALLDLHSASAPTPPFAIASRVPQSETFAASLGLEYVTLGWDGPGLLGDKVMLAALTRRDCPGVAVECGQHDDPQAAEVAYQVALRALGYFGIIQPPPLPEPARAPERLLIRAAVKRPSHSFRFARPLMGMEQLEPGQVIARGDFLELSVRTRCRVIMPNDRVDVGDDLLYLAEQL